MKLRPVPFRAQHGLSHITVAWALPQHNTGGRYGSSYMDMLSNYLGEVHSPFCAGVEVEALQGRHVRHIAPPYPQVEDEIRMAHSLFVLSGLTPFVNASCRGRWFVTACLLCGQGYEMQRTGAHVHHQVSGGDFVVVFGPRTPPTSSHVLLHWS